MAEEGDSPRRRMSSPMSSPPESLLSSPLSVLSKSPSPPSSPTDVADPTLRYPSPSATTPSGTQSPVKLDEAVIREGANDSPTSDGAPPAKKRRIAKPKPRTTEYLDLERYTRNLEEKENPDAVHFERLVRALQKKKKIVVIAGAGISVSAGIPDFRSSSGLFKTLKTQHNLKASGKHLFDASVYRHDDSTQSFHTMVRELAHLTSNARPTPFHHLLASLAEEGRLMRLYTQNVDCIDTNMEPLATTVPLNRKGPWPLTIQLHGGLQKMVCTKCGHLDTFEAALFDGPQAPLCEKCKEQEMVRLQFANKRSQGIGRLRPRIVLYNESNPDEEAIGNVSMADLRSRPDAVLVVGTSLKIPGVRRLVKEFCQVTRGRRDGFTAWLNLDPEPQGIEFKECWDLIVRGNCDHVAQLAELPRWDDKDIAESVEVSEEDKKILLQQRGLEVQLSPRSRLDEETVAASPRSDKAELFFPAKSKQVPGIPTPGASPKLGTAGPLKQPSKPKQSKLSFGRSHTDPEGHKGKTASKKPTGPRKPGQPKRKPLPSKSTISNTFKTVKNPAVRPKTPEKKKQTMDPESSDLSSPPDLPDLNSSPLSALLAVPPLRPARTVSDSLSFKREEPSSELSDLSLPPSTPTRATMDRCCTISPGSVPRGMERLVD